MTTTDIDSGPDHNGTEDPRHYVTNVDTGVLVRTFAFLDLCGSTRFLEHHGGEQTRSLLTFVRNNLRHIAGVRGVRIAKWMGDGAMLVGVAPGPVIATAVEAVERSRGLPLALRGGVSISAALLLDGDDYVGRGANFAARLCDQAEPHTVLCDIDCLSAVPTWIHPGPLFDVTISGMGDHQVSALQANQPLRDLWWIPT